MLKCCFGSAPSSPGEALSPTANQTPEQLGHVKAKSAVPVETVGLHPQAGPGAAGTPVVPGGPSPVTETAVAASDINSIRLSELGPSGQVHPSLHDSRPSHPSSSQQPCSPSSAVLPPWLSNPNNSVPAAWALEETSMPPPDSGENTISATADITHNTVSEILRAHLSEVSCSVGSAHLPCGLSSSAIWFEWFACNNAEVALPGTCILYIWCPKTTNPKVTRKLQPFLPSHLHCTNKWKELSALVLTNPVSMSIN